MRQTTLCNAIKWALARPNARWDVMAFGSYLDRKRIAWRTKTIQTRNRTTTTREMVVE